ncbi:MAG: shikimate kinase AroL [Gemmataceae bacterium]
MPDRIHLIGYRGTGKTTVGRLVAAALGWSFADADDVIEATAGRSIASIFAAEGEAGFRDREAAALRELTADRLVVATGGGAVLRPENRDLLQSSGLTVWLTAPVVVIWDRLQTDPLTAARRPNLTAAGGAEEVRAVLAAREPLYRATAHHTVETAGRSPDEVAADILRAWAAR